MPDGHASTELPPVLLRCCHHDFHVLTPGTRHYFGRIVKKFLLSSRKGRNREALQRPFDISIQLVAGNADAMIEKL